MAVKGKTTYSKKGGAAKVTKAKVVSKGKTPGTGKADHSKAIRAAVDKALSKTIETQHSYIDILMHHQTPLKGTGLDLSSLNVRNVRDANNQIQEAFDNNSCMAYNLSNMMQVRSASSVTASGWRAGFKTNVLSIRVDVRGTVGQVSAECKYHALIARKKDGVRPTWHTPTLTTLDDSQLWRKNYSGPYGHSYFHYDFPTLDKKNTEVWSFPTGCHVEKSVSPVTLSGASRTFQLSMYKEIKDVWEFNTDLPKADPTVKDGDYCLFIFREGPDDYDARDASIRVTIDIAFKDC